MKTIFTTIAATVFILSSGLTSFGQSKRKPDVAKILGNAAKSIQLAKKNGTLKAVPTKSYSYNEYNQLPADMRVPGQFEENQAIAITWPYGFQLDSNNNYYRGDTLIDDNSADGFGPIICDLANAIQQNATVIIRVHVATDSAKVKNIMMARGTPLVNYRFYVQQIDDWWDRDSGPITFYYGAQDSIGMVDMDYYTYEALVDEEGFAVTDYSLLNSFGRVHDDSIPIRIGQLLNYPVYNTQLNNEGGNLMFDGLQTVWTSTGARFTNRDAIRPPLFDSLGNFVRDANGNFIDDTTQWGYANYPTTDDIQYAQLTATTFNTTTMVEPEVFSCDGGTGHLDIYMKLIDENNLALIDYSQATNHDDFDEWNTNLQMLQSLNDANGKPITMHKLPMPLTASGTVQVDCELDQRTYVNGVFVNKAFIMPVMSDTANLAPADVAAITAFQKAMPGYKVMPINAAAMYGTGGSLHCITMQIPAENPIFIRHNALTGNQPLLPSYAMSATVKNKSGLLTTKVFYKKSTSNVWLAINMVAGGFGQYNFSIPSTGFVNGDTIQYFIEAESNNGKTISKPFTAREGGAYRFIVGGNSALGDLNETTNFALSAYPNPSSASFTLPISLDQTRQVEIEFLDLSGRIIFTKNLNLEKGLHLQNFSKGVDFDSNGLYLINVKVDGNLLSTQRIVVQ